MKPKPNEILAVIGSKDKQVTLLDSGWKVDSKGNRVGRWFECGLRGEGRVWRGHANDLPYLIRTHQKLKTRIARLAALKAPIIKSLFNRGRYANFKIGGYWGEVECSEVITYSPLRAESIHLEQLSIRRPAVIINFDLGQPIASLSHTISSTYGKLFMVNRLIITYVKNRLPKPTRCSVLMQVHLTHGTLFFEAKGHTSCCWWEHCSSISATTEMLQSQLSKLPV